VKEEGHQRRGGLVWPVILIGAGVVFLLNNLGVLGWGVWDLLWRLWPVLLIAAGLDILIGRRSIWGSAFVALFLMAVFAGALVWGLPRIGSVGELTTETVNLPLGSATRAEVEIDFGTGRLELHASPEAAGLVEGTVALSRGERLNAERRQTGNTVYAEVRSHGNWSYPSGTWTAGDKVWDLGLSRDVPISLKISTGVGRSNLDLSRLQVTDLTLDGGVGQVTISLPRTGRLDGSIEGGIGEVIVLVPAGVAARIRVDGGLGGVNVSGSYARMGDTYTTPGYDTAENRADLRIEGGIGRVIVRPLPAE